MNNNLLFSS